MYLKTPFNSPSEAIFIARFIASTEGGFLTTKVKSVIDPSGTGTRNALPPILPSNFGNILVNAFAAPVLVGTIETAAALALLKSE